MPQWYIAASFLSLPKYTRPSRHTAEPFWLKWLKPSFWANSVRPSCLKSLTFELKTVAGTAGWMPLPRGHFWHSEPAAHPLYQAAATQYWPLWCSTPTAPHGVVYDYAPWWVLQCAACLFMMCNAQTAQRTFFGVVFSMDWTLTNRFGPWWYLTPPPLRLSCLIIIMLLIIFAFLYFMPPCFFCSLGSHYVNLGRDIRLTETYKWYLHNIYKRI